MGGDEVFQAGDSMCRGAEHRVRALPGSHHCDRGQAPHCCCHRWATFYASSSVPSLLRGFVISPCEPRERQAYAHFAVKVSSAWGGYLDLHSRSASPAPACLRLTPARALAGLPLLRVLVVTLPPCPVLPLMWLRGLPEGSGFRGQQAHWVRILKFPTSNSQTAGSPKPYFASASCPWRSALFQQTPQLGSGPRSIQLRGSAPLSLGQDCITHKAQQCLPQGAERPSAPGGVGGVPPASGWRVASFCCGQRQRGPLSSAWPLGQLLALRAGGPVQLGGQEVSRLGHPHSAGGAHGTRPRGFPGAAAQPFSSMESRPGSAFLESP